jgi:hypothetical protein
MKTFCGQCAKFKGERGRIWGTCGKQAAVFRDHEACNDFEPRIQEEKKPVKKTVAKKTAATKKKVTAGRKKTGSGTPRKTKKRAGSSSEK